MKGKLLPFGDDTYIVEDHIYRCLMEPSEYDGVVQTYLQVLFLSLGKLSNKLFKDHLPGGKLVGMDPTVVAKFKCTPKTSCFAESVFGQLDHLLKSKPNLSTLAAEAYITFSNNKTLNWLLNKPELERNILIEEATKNVKTVRKKFKQRRKEIEESRRLALEKAIKKREDIQQEKIKKQEEYTKSILNHGLWQTSNEIDSMLLSYKTKTDKIDALKAQLKFRKDVLLQQPEEKQTFNITKKREDSTSRVNLTVEELTLNLKKLIKQAIVMDQQSGKAEHILVGKRVRHKFKTTVNGEVSYEWYAGKVISQVQNQVHILIIRFTFSVSDTGRLLFFFLLTTAVI